MRKNIVILIILSLFGITSMSFAQGYQVSASIDSTVIYIGQQCNITFKVNQPSDIKIYPPVISDTIVTGIEVLNYSSDTVSQEEGYISVNHNYLITSFDSALYYIPEYPFVYNSDTMWTNSLSLKVLTIPVDIDTTTQVVNIADIKDVVEPPFDWGLIKIIALIVLGLLLFIVICIWVWKRYFKNKKEEPKDEKIPQIIKSCDEIALEKLALIREEKIWQSGRIKEYYTQITDVLREYIEARYSIIAFERTSAEIMDSLDFMHKGSGEEPDSFMLLKQIFSVSDMVKFAKFIPDFNVNTDTLSKAVNFVESTKEIDNNKLNP